MDIISAKLGANMAIKALESDGRIGSGSASAPITFDGYVDGLQTIPMGEIITMYRISDALPNIPEPNRIVISSNGQPDTIYNHAQLMVVNEDGMNTIIGTDSEGNTTGFVVNVPDSPEAEVAGIASGLYVFGWISFPTDDGREKAGAWVSSIEFVGEIKPIDPKYLPGVCLPVVELETAIDGETALSESDGAKLTACIGLPVIVKFALGTIVCDYAADEGMYMFVNYGTAQGGFMSEDGTNWIFTNLAEE